MLKTNYYRNIFIMFKGTSIAQLIPIIFLPLFSRIFSPAVIGEYGIIYALGAIVGSVAGMKMEMSIVEFDKIIDKKRVLGSTLYISIPVATSLVVIIAMVIQWLGLENIKFNLNYYGYVLSIALLNSITMQLTYYNASFARFKSNSVAKIGTSVTTILLQILLGVFINNQIFWLVISRIAGLAFGIYILAKNINLQGVLSTNWKVIRRVMWRVRRYTIYYWPASIIDTIGLQIPVILIGGLFSKEFAGQYSMAHRGISLPTSIISNAITHVFFKEFTDNVVQNKNYHHTIISTWKVLFLIGIIPFAVLFVWGETLTIYVLGSDWSLAGKIVSLISPMAFLIFLSSPTSTAMISLEGQKYMLYFSIAGLLYKIVALYVGYRNDDLLLGITILVIAHSMQIILYNVVILRLMQRKVRK